MPESHHAHFNPNYEYPPNWLVNSRPYIDHHHHRHDHYPPPLPPSPETPQVTPKPEGAQTTSTGRTPIRAQVDFLKSFIAPFLAVVGGFG